LVAVRVALRVAVVPVEAALVVVVPVAGAHLNE